MIDGPILVISSGMRTGSTLMQRLISSHKDIFVWGEFSIFKELHQIYKKYNNRNIDCSKFLDSYFERNDVEHGPNANIMPSSINNSIRMFLDNYYLSDITKTKIWGVKHTDSHPDYLHMMEDIYDDVYIIHLTRNPLDVIRSLYGFYDNKNCVVDSFIKRNMDIWFRINSMFLTNKFRNYKLFKYEDIKNKTDFINSLASFLDINVDDLNSNVLNKVINSTRKDIDDNVLLSKHKDIFNYKMNNLIDMYYRGI